MKPSHAAGRSRSSAASSSPPPAARSLLPGTAEGGNRAIETGAAQCVLTPGTDRRPVLHRRREAPPRHPRGPSRRRCSRCAWASSTRRPASRSRARQSTSGTPTRPATTPASAAAQSSRTFLRGVQKTDANGLAVFTTIYPGWYQGRAVHIHVKVHVGGNVVHTGQLFFSDALTDAVYKTAPYAARGAPDMTKRAGHRSSSTAASAGCMDVKKSGSGVRRRDRRWACTRKTARVTYSIVARDALDRRARRRRPVAGVQHGRGRAVGAPGCRRGRDAVVHRPPLRLARARAAGRGRVACGGARPAPRGRRARRDAAGRRSSTRPAPIAQCTGAALHPVPPDT